MAAPPKLDAGATPYDLSIREWNRHVDASNAYHETQSRGSRGGQAGSNRDSNIVKVKNLSGADRLAGEILEFTGWALDADSLAGELPLIWLSGGSPSLANAFGVLVRPCPAGDLEDCVVAGACVARVTVSSATHKFAAVQSSTYKLISAASGPIKILYKPSGTGEKACAVLLGSASIEIYRGITADPITLGGAGTVLRYDGDSFDETGDEDEVISESAPIPSGKVVYYVRIADSYFLLNNQKSAQVVMSDVRENAGGTQIEAQSRTCYVDSVDTAAYSDKIPLDECTA